MAQPLDDAPKGEWWSIYNDPLLDKLERQVVINNQTVKEYVALLEEAQATVDIARSSLFPTLSVTGTGTRSHNSSGGSTTSTGTTSTTSTTGTTTSGFSGSAYATNRYSLEGAFNWDLDVWGRIRRQVESDVAAAQVSSADLTNATLTAQAMLATDYFDLRNQDSLDQLYKDTIKAYADALRITQNQYNAGTVSLANVAAAQTQLDSTVATEINVGVLRSQYEHAIAVLTGVSPAELSILPGKLAADVPVPPVVVPSLLLQRRPDIASAERKMAEQNALIGVQIAAYFPDISLSAIFGYSGTPLGTLISASNELWSLGATATQTLFEGGLRNSEVAAARAAYRNAVATYRQTVLTAFQQVEDELSALRILERQAAAEDTAVRSAQKSLQVALNTYIAGTVPYTSVITEQTALLSAQQSALAVQQQRLVASVALVQALGGGFSTLDLPSRGSFQQGLPFLKY